MFLQMIAPSVTIRVAVSMNLGGGGFERSCLNTPFGSDSAAACNETRPSTPVCTDKHLLLYEGPLVSAVVGAIEALL